MNILGEFNIHELGTSGVITIVVVVLTLLGFIKGAVKLVFLLFTLAGAGYAGYWGSEVGVHYIQGVWPGAPEYLGTACAAVCGLVAFYLLSKIFGFFTDPFEKSGFISRIAFGIPAALVSLIAAVGLVWLSLNFLKDKGAEGELKYWITQDDSEDGGRLKDYPVLASLKQKFDSSAVGKAVSGLYGYHDREKHNLAKLLVIANTSMDKMRYLAQDERVAKLLGNADVQRLINDEGVQDQISENDVQGLLANPELKDALKDGDLLDDLLAIGAEKLK